LRGTIRDQSPTNSLISSSNNGKPASKQVSYLVLQANNNLMSVLNWSLWLVRSGWSWTDPKASKQNDNNQENLERKKPCLPPGIFWVFHSM